MIPTTLSDTSHTLNQILQHLPDAVFTLDCDLTIRFANPAFCELTGFSTQELIGKSIQNFLGDLSILDACQAELNHQGFCRDQETTFKRKDGSQICVSKNVQTWVDANQKTGIIVSLRDLTEIHELNKSLSQLTEKLERYNQNLSSLVLRRTQTLNEQMAFLGGYKKALDASSMVSKCNAKQQILEVNTRLCARTGYRPQELLGQACNFLWSDDCIGLLDEINETVVSARVWKGLVTLCSKDGEPIYVETYIVPILDENQQIRELVNISHDISPLIETTHSLHQRLHYDGLTKLPNRTKLLTDLEEVKNPVKAVLFNIDSFNEINTFYGHLLADQLLKALSKRLYLVAQRIEAKLYKLPIDEFALLIDQPVSLEQVEQLIQQCLDELTAEAFVLDNEKISLSLSVGIAASSAEDAGSQDVLTKADMALKTAKKQRKSLLSYDPALNIKQGYEQNIHWVRRLRRALDEQRLVAYFQPIVDAKTRQVERYECLMRMIDESGEVISPFFFLDIAKRLKLYPQLTKRMIKQSFEYFAPRHEAFSINLSIEDIVDSKLSQWILHKVRDCAFASRIIFEIVESEGIQNYDVVNEFIQEVKRYGVKIAIDDFGAGYSNFAYIMRLDIDYIKIDGSIIRDICTNHSSQVITQTIVDFAQKLGIDTVAEFVADEAIYQYLSTLPISSMQGYLFGQPQAHPL
ncbi:MAG: EAL domain-containing protein [Thiomicrospira sp.]|jgi:PAS domain S-box-containing protein/diguanylate cyclase (GGDEF)-like protein|nr:EAL domain-containing protein [Thiomicrospira sp.]